MVFQEKCAADLGRLDGTNAAAPLVAMNVATRRRVYFSIVLYIVITVACPHQLPPSSSHGGTTGGRADNTVSPNGEESERGTHGVERRVRPSCVGSDACSSPTNQPQVPSVGSGWLVRRDTHQLTGDASSRLTLKEDGLAIEPKLIDLLLNFWGLRLPLSHADGTGGRGGGNVARASLRQPWEEEPDDDPGVSGSATSTSPPLVPNMIGIRCVPGSIYKDCVSLCFEQADTRSSTAWWGVPGSPKSRLEDMDPSPILHEGEAGGSFRHFSDVQALAACLRDCRLEYIDTPTPGCVTSYGNVVPGAPVDDPESGKPVYPDGVRVPGSFSYYVHRELHRFLGDRVFQQTLILLVFAVSLSVLVALSIRFSEALADWIPGTTSGAASDSVRRLECRMIQLLEAARAYGDAALAWVKKRSTFPPSGPEALDATSALLDTETDEEVSATTSRTTQE